MKKNSNFWQTRLGFLTLLMGCYTLKYLFVAYFDFDLGLSDPYQHIIMWLSPFGLSLLLLSLGLYFAKPLISYLMMLLLDTLNTILLFANVIYYRQFNDFLTFKTIENVGKVSQGLGKSTVALLHPSDLLIWLDLIVIIGLLCMKKLKIDSKRYGLSHSFAITSLGAFMLSLNMFLAETSRPRLLVNTFDRTYVVKYLGLDTYTVYDLVKSAQSNSIKRSANADELNKILSFTKKNSVPPDSKYFDKAAGKNVIIIHLESFQQFLINLKVNGQEVTPFLNSLYKNKHTISFSNFYHQVGLGRTSDAENMLETGVYGISDGSVFTSLGSENTFQAAPQILRQKGYTSAVFHGNVGTFWNRNEVYKNLGYNYFFDSSYFSQNKDDISGYGVKDKLLFAESVKYLEQLQQPFYVKFLTVTNHIPFDLSTEDQDDSFQTTSTSDPTINNYFQTAHYLDQALQEFFNYLKKSGLYKNSMIIVYGDHYGLADSENPTLAPILGKNAADWTDFDNIGLQRVPFMIHMNNLKGGVKKETAGEIDVLPTLLHLLGVKTKNYVQFGTDMLSPKHRQMVVFRNGTIVTPKYVIVGGKGIKGTVYDNQTGLKIKHFTIHQKQVINALAKKASQSLHFSDLLNNRNLLRFYTPAGFIPVTPNQFDYKTNWQQMLTIRKELANKSTSLYSRHHGTTTGDYRTDAPELKNRESEITTVPDSITQTNDSSENSSSTSSQQSSSHITH